MPRFTRPIIQRDARSDLLTFRKSCLLTAKKVLLTVSLLCCVPGCHGQRPDAFDSSSAKTELAMPITLPDVPAPKVELGRPARRSRFALDRPVLVWGLSQGIAEIYDGYTTRRVVRTPNGRENDPLSLFILGRKPTWRRMVLFGSMEDIATMYLHQRMRTSRNRTVRRLAPFLPITLIGIHFVEGTGNWSGISKKK